MNIHKYKREKKSQEPFQSYLLTGQADLAKKVTLKGLMGFFFLFSLLIIIYFFKYETIVSRNGLSLGYSEQDTSSVRSKDSEFGKSANYRMTYIQN